MAEIRFDGRVAIVTGAGNGLGKAFAKLLAERGAKVVVNDLGTSLTGVGSSREPADETVAEILAQGGEAIASYDSVVDGAKIVQAAIDAFERVDILVNNASIIRDSTFKKMSDKDWDAIYEVNGKGFFAVTRAAWPHMERQKYGRIVNITGSAPLYGNFGQANYSAMGRVAIGATLALAIEGRRNNIKVNAVAAAGESRMLQEVMPDKKMRGLPPLNAAKAVAYMCHESCEPTGGIFEVAGSFVAQLRWERSRGVTFPRGFSLEDVAAHFDEVSDFGRDTEHPGDVKSALEMMKSKL